MKIITRMILVHTQPITLPMDVIPRILKYTQVTLRLLLVSKQFSELLFAHTRDVIQIGYNTQNTSHLFAQTRNLVLLRNIDHSINPMSLVLHVGNVAISTFTRLTALDISNSCFAYQFTSLTNLTKLSVDSCKDNISHMTNLRTLTLANSYINEIPTSVRNLSLRDSSFAHIKASLVSLSLVNSRVRKISPCNLHTFSIVSTASPSGIITCTRGLTSLTAIGSSLPDDFLTNLPLLRLTIDNARQEHLTTLTSLTYLDICRSYVASSLLVGLPLVYLDWGIPGKHLNDVCIDTLQTLIIFEDAVNDQSLSKLTALTHLDMTTTKTTVTGAGLRTLTNLRKLVLHNSSINASDIKHLKLLSHIGAYNSNLRAGCEEGIYAYREMYDGNRGSKIKVQCRY